MNKRVCIIRSNSVQPDSRVEKEAYTLSKLGYDVTILAWDRSSCVKEREGIIDIADTKIRIIWLGYKAGFGQGIKSLKSFLRFQFAMGHWIKKHHYQYDIIHACDYDTAIVASFVARRLKKHLVFDIFDFLFAEPKGILQRIICKMQKDVINKCDATIICTESRLEQIQGTTPKELYIIHNTPFLEQLDKNESKMVQIDSERVKVVYVGVFLDERLLKPIGQFMSKNHDVEWHVAGFGLLDSYFYNLSENNDNIFYYGKISYSKALKLESECDIMLAIYDPSDENCRRAAPNKFYESLMLGKPVIMTKGTGMSDVVEDNNIGILIDFSEEGFETGLRELITRKACWTEMSDRAKYLYSSMYSWEIMTERIKSLYERIGETL